MAKLKYVGDYPAVDVPLPLGGIATVVKGDVLKTSDTHAEALALQPSNWQPVEDEKKAESKKESAEKPAETLNQDETA